ncbi:A disintegrin and metalloproteinase with thrombospondin motifs adt-2-like isoform X2 [Linepithema humile]|uniref:A disintegrin and metalloproteinase with thrombospondin motifs adt-2-like isoform X2 n=1 Tax=Linepithema humile TaxID=83485 RepID=UPI00351F50F3
MKDHVSSAIINFCDEYGLEGLVFLKNDNFEIKPLRNDLASLSLLDDIYVQEQINLSFGKPHLIKRSLQYFANSSLYHFDNFKSKQRYVRNTQQKLIVELAVFFDKSATDKNKYFLRFHYKKLRNLIFAYVNQIQLLFHHPSLGVSIDIWLVHLEIMQEQPKSLPVYDFEKKKIFTASEILQSFCNYATLSLRKKRHWDLGLYISGLDFSFIRQGNGGIEGLAYIGRLCKNWSSCAIAKFGAVPRAVHSGFAAARIAAHTHEIAHVLGAHHDVEIDGKCNKDKYLMGNNWLKRGQATWSECSRNQIEELDEKCLRNQARSINLDDAYAFYHLRYHDLPGREWTAKAQCELHFRDHNANVVTLHDICDTLECEVPSTSNDKTSYNRIGAPLDGTYCAPRKECRGGKCVPVQEPPYIFNYYRKDKWSEWEVGPCKSSCIEKSKGVQIRRRFCVHRNKRTANCKGPYYDVVMCNDFSCNFFTSQTIYQFALKMCWTLSKAMERFRGPTIQLENRIESSWKQASHDVEKPWIACTIFCLLKNTSTYYLVREIMFDFERYPYILFPYFPDGTWCHKDKDGQDYYCRQHYCLPENYSFKKQYSRDYRHV